MGSSSPKEQIGNHRFCDKSNWMTVKLQQFDTVVQICDIVLSTQLQTRRNHLRQIGHIPCESMFFSECRPTDVLKAGVKAVAGHTSDPALSTKAAKALRLDPVFSGSGVGAGSSL